MVGNCLHFKADLWSFSTCLGDDGIGMKRRLHLPVSLSRGIPHGGYVERVKGRLFEAPSSVRVRTLFRLGVSWGGCVEMQTDRRGINNLILVSMRKK